VGCGSQWLRRLLLALLLLAPDVRTPREGEKRFLGCVPALELPEPAPELLGQLLLCYLGGHDCGLDFPYERCLLRAAEAPVGKPGGTDACGARSSATGDGIGLPCPVGRFCPGRAWRGGPLVCLGGLWVRVEEGPAVLRQLVAIPQIGV
jgi:hypothetical protein